MKPLLFIFMLFSITSTAQETFIIYTLKLDSFNKEALSKFDSFSIRFKEGPYIKIFENFDTYMRLDSIYGNTFRLIDKELRNNNSWKTFKNSNSGPIKITDTDGCTLTIYFYYAGLMKKWRYEQKGIDGQCYGQPTWFSKSGIPYNYSRRKRHFL